MTTGKQSGQGLHAPSMPASVTLEEDSSIAKQDMDARMKWCDDPNWGAHSGAFYDIVDGVAVDCLLD